VNRGAAAGDIYRRSSSITTAPIRTPTPKSPFVDEQLPPHYAPFNVQAVGGDVVVSYVLHQKGEQFESDGPGIDVVDTFSSSGRLLERLERGGWLNAPWGLALAPLDFGCFSKVLLIGQFAGTRDTESSGFTAACDLAPGKAA
jgi:uncharacterized protein (TIGR03118 family)